MYNLEAFKIRQASRPLLSSQVNFVTYLKLVKSSSHSLGVNKLTMASNFGNGHPHHSNETVERIRRLAAQKLSAQAIGYIEGMSKSAVIGLCHRNNIQLQGTRGKNIREIKGTKINRPPKQLQEPQVKNLSVRVRPRTVDVCGMPTVDYHELEYRAKKRKPTCMWHNCKGSTELGKPYCTVHMRTTRGSR